MYRIILLGFVFLCNCRYVPHKDYSDGQVKIFNESIIAIEKNDPMRFCPQPEGTINFTNAKWLALFAHLAQVKSEKIQGYLSSIGLKSPRVDFLDNNTGSHATFIESSEVAILSFRGTELDDDQLDVRDLMTDAMALHRNTSFGNFLLGASNSYTNGGSNSLQNQIFNIIGGRPKNSSSKPLWVTGLSLGASLGQIFLADLTNRMATSSFTGGYRLSGAMYFGNMRTMDQPTANRVNGYLHQGRNLVKITHFKNPNDAVPDYPPTFFNAGNQINLRSYGLNTEIENLVQSHSMLHYHAAMKKLEQRYPSSCDILR